MTEESKTQFTAYVRKEGRMTVPKGVRDALGIREGDLVNCTIGKVKSRFANRGGRGNLHIHSLDEGQVIVGNRNVRKAEK